MCMQSEHEHAGLCGALLLLLSVWGVFVFIFVAFSLCVLHWVLFSRCCVHLFRSLALLCACHVVFIS